MGCFSCGKSFNKKETSVIAQYKKEFKELGIERWVYRLCPKCDLMIIKREYFNEVFQKEIKPNLSKGAEYMHIAEFTGS